MSLGFDRLYELSTPAGCATAVLFLVVAAVLSFFVGDFVDALVFVVLTFIALIVLVPLFKGLYQWINRRGDSQLRAALIVGSIPFVILLLVSPAFTESSVSYVEDRWHPHSAHDYYDWNFTKAQGAAIAYVSLLGLLEVCRRLWDSRVPRSVTALAAIEAMLGILFWVYYEFNFRYLWFWQEVGHVVEINRTGTLIYELSNGTKGVYNLGTHFIRGLRIADNDIVLAHDDASLMVTFPVLLVLGGLALALSFAFATVRAVWRSIRS